MNTNRLNTLEQVKYYVGQVLDGINCVDQTNQSLVGINTCFYLDMDFEHLERLTQPVIKHYVSRDTQQYIDQIVDYIEVKSIYKDYIDKYKVIVSKHVDQSFTNWFDEFARHYLNIVISDIYNLGDSRDYPKGLKTRSDYFEDLFEDDIVFHSSVKLEDFSKVADIFDTKMKDLKDKIVKQRLLDGI